MPRACSWSMAMTRPPASGWARRTSASRSHRLPQHRRQPLAVDGECRPQPLVGERARQRVVEGRLVAGAVRRGPLHLAAGPREVDRTHHASVAERVAVAVLVVGDGLVLLVAHERDGLGVAPEWRARQGQASGRAVERRPQRATPRLVLGRMVDLVEHDVRPPATSRMASATHGHLLVAGHDAVHVRRQAALGRGPRRVEMELQRAAAAWAHWTLRCAVGATTTTGAARSARAEPERGQGEGRLAGAGCRDGQEVGPAGRRAAARGRRAARGADGRYGTWTSTGGVTAAGPRVSHAAGRHA